MAIPEKISYPFGKADIVSLANAAAMAATIDNALTFITIDAMAQDSTLNLTIDSGLQAGAELIIKAPSDTTARAFIPGTGMSGTNVTGIISKTNVIRAIYDGTNFVIQSARLIN